MGNPVHPGHIQMLHQAKLRLERERYSVVSAWLSPSHDINLKDNSTVSGTKAMSLEFRLHASDLAVQDDSFISVGRWESSRDKFSDSPDVTQSLVDTVQKHFGGLNIRVFYVCGADHAKKC